MRRLWYWPRASRWRWRWRCPRWLSRRRRSCCARVSGSRASSWIWAVSGFQVRVGGASRQIPTGDVAVIDFSGSTSFPDNEVNQVQAGKHLIVLSSGQVVSGNLYDVGGTQPKRISVHTDTGNRDFASNEVRRIYLARPSGSRARAYRSRRPRRAPIHAAGNRRTDSCAGATSAGPTPASPCAGATASRSTRAARYSSAATPATRPDPAGATSGRRPSGPMPQRARRRADRTCGPGGGLSPSATRPRR